MGNVEKYWRDITIYSVEFVSHSLGFKCKHRKTLAFSNDISKEDVYHLLPIYLNEIDEILYVDEIADGLLLKDKVSYV